MVAGMRLLGLTLTPRQYVRVADVALILLTLIVFTGAGVRLTGSGLGCPDWPKCYGGYVAPLDSHAWIEYGNRLVTGVIGFVAIAAGLLAWRVRPFRRDLALLGCLPLVGVLAQAVLGGFTVKSGIEPEFVMAHFGLSLVCLVLGFALAWRARYAPGDRPPATDALATWSVRALLGVGTVAFFAGSVASGSGPHSGGGGTGDVIRRLDWSGPDTMTWAIYWHGRLANFFGLCTVAVFFLLRRRGASHELQRVVGLIAILIAVQGAVGLLQYFVLALPAELVWLHVVLATLTWLALLWAVALAGRLQPAKQRRVAAASAAEPAEQTVAA
jgi:cytochrome c oxidase assembly protein subunit 15